MAKMDSAAGPSLLHWMRRLDSLEECVLHSLVDDQELFVEGIIMAHRALVGVGTLMNLEKRRQLDLHAATAAPHVVGMASQVGVGVWNHDCHSHHQEQDCCRQRDEPAVLQALQLLSEVDAAIAWCEGKMAVTTHLFPPLLLRQKSNPNRRQLHHGGSSGFNDWDSLNSPEAVAPLCQRSPELQTGDVGQNCTERLDGNLQSRSQSRHRAWVADTPILPSSSIAGRDDDDDDEEHAVCHLDFDRWTARLVSSQAQHDKRRLWLHRCVAEEAVSRHAAMVEERLGRVTLLVSAREELAAGVEPSFRAQTRKKLPHLLEMELREAEQRVQQWLHAQDELLDAALRSVQKGMELFQEACQKQLQEGVSRSCKREVVEEEEGEEVVVVVEQMETTGSACKGSVVGTVLDGPRATWSSFTHALLDESEETQRLHIDTEARLSWELLLANWQSILNHVNSKQLIAAKEGLMHEFAGGFKRFSPTHDFLPGSSVWLLGDEESNAGGQKQQQPPSSRSLMLSNIQGTSVMECSRNPSLQPLFVPPTRQPAQDRQTDITPLSGGSRHSAVTRLATHVAANSTTTTTAAAAACITDDEVRDGFCVADRSPPAETSVLSSFPPSHSLQLLLHARRMGRSGSYDIALYICMSVELVKRKQIVLVEQHSRLKLAARLDKELEVYVRRWRRSTLL